MARGQYRRAVAARPDRPTQAARRRRAAAPWIIASLAVVVLLSGASFGYAWSRQPSGCRQPAATATVVASADHFPVLSGLADRWRKTAPEIDRRCATITVVRKDASAVAAALSSSWEESRDGPRPDVWAPDSSAWMLVARGRPDAGALLPANPPSLASSAQLMAMPEPMARTLGWPARPLGWVDLAGAFPLGTTWKKFGHADWGPLQLGMTDPTRSTAGLAAVLGVSDLDGDGKTSDRELGASLVFSRAVADQLYLPASGQMLALVRDAASAEQAMRTVSAFPISEQELATFDASSPAVNLVPVYPKEGTFFADYPYAVLAAPWVDATRQRVAAAFLRYVQGVNGRRAYAEAGFRDASRSGANAAPLDPARGFAKTVPARARPLPGPAAVTGAVVGWGALRRQSNVLAVLDTSGSMAKPVPGLNASRLDVLKAAAIRSLGLWNESTSVGLWQFSTDLVGNRDYRELVPIGPVKDTVNRAPRRAALATAIQGLQPGGNTGLYRTTLAAYQAVQAAWKPNHRNLVVILTDGQDDNQDELTRAALVARLRELSRPDQPVQVLSIAYTADADVPALSEISRATGGRVFISRNPADIEKVFLAVLFGR